MPKIISKVADVAEAQGYATPAALARAAQLDPSTVARVWSGEAPRFVRYSTMRKIGKALRVRDLGELLVYVDE